MAFTKKEKKEIVTNYEKWIKESNAMYVLTYNKMRMQDINVLRAEAREIGGEFHVVKNTLMKIALKNCGLEDHGYFSESSMAAFAFEDAPGLAKIIDKANSTDLFSIKGGFMDGAMLDAQSVLAFSKLPPLPQMRAQLLALIQTPATQLVRSVAEPARQIAAVIKAFSEKSPAPSAG